MKADFAECDKFYSKLTNESIKNLENVMIYKAITDYGFKGQEKKDLFNKITQLREEQPEKITVTLRKLDEAYKIYEMSNASLSEREPKEKTKEEMDELYKIFDEPLPTLTDIEILKENGLYKKITAEDLTKDKIGNVYGLFEQDKDTNEIFKQPMVYAGKKGEGIDTRYIFCYSKGIELRQDAYSMDDLENMELNNVVGNAEYDESWKGLMTSGLGDKYDLQKFCKTEEFENRGPEL